MVKRDISVYKDFIGREYGDLVVKSYNEEKSSTAKRIMFDCTCKLCGSTCTVSLNDLTSGNKTDCGCKAKNERHEELIRQKAKELIGKEFNNLIVKSFNRERSDETGRFVWDCECKLCGNVVPVFEFSLPSRKDCGCTLRQRKSENALNRNIKSANEYIKSINYDYFGSKIIGVNVEQTKIKRTVIIDLQCKSCGETYSLDLIAMKKGVGGKVCRNCIGRGRNSSSFKDLSGEIVGNYQINNLNSFYNNNSYWNCTNSITGDIEVLSIDYINKIKRDTRPRVKPFIFIDKENK